jgi:hypothetical protein
MSLEARIRQLESSQEPPDDSTARIVIYKTGEDPDSPNDGRVRLFLPDNGRGPSEDNHVA